MGENCIGDEGEFYCEFCGSCGEVGCCSLENFVKQHIIGKTTCLHENEYVSEILSMIEELEKKYEQK